VSDLDVDVDLVRAAMEAFRRRDAAALYELQDPAFELRSALAGLTGGGYSGPGHVERYFADIDEQLEDWHTEDERYVDAGDGRVLVLYRVVGRGRQSGIPLDRVISMLWTLRAAKLVRAETFLDPMDALRATGLESLDTLRRVNEAVSDGDIRAVTALLDPDVVWEHNVGVGSPEEGIYRGRQAVAQLFERIIEPWELMRPEPYEITVLGEDTFRVVGRLHAKHTISAAEIVAPYEQQLEIRDGLLAHGRMTTGEMAPSGALELREEGARVE